MGNVDLSGPMFTTAEMTRADVEAAIKASDGHGVDLAGKSLNGLDLSGLDLTKANFRAARMNKAKSLRGENSTALCSIRSGASGRTFAARA